MINPIAHNHLINSIGDDEIHCQCIIIIGTDSSIIFTKIKNKVGYCSQMSHYIVDGMLGRLDIEENFIYICTHRLPTKNGSDLSSVKRVLIICN